MSAIQKSWNSKITGILVTDGFTTFLRTDKLNFLGYTLEEE